MSGPIYTASRIRRTRDDIDAIKTAMTRILETDQPMTLRGLYYRLVSEGVIPKTEAEYEKVGRYLLQLRREGVVPYGWVADGTRWMRKPTSFDSMEDALASTARAYRRALWIDQGAYVECWIEKDALAGVVVRETAAYDVPLMVARGFASESFLHEAAEDIAASGAPAFLYLFTDYDPSGMAIAAHIERALRGFLPGYPVTVERMAVTPEQISEWRLPTRPTKTTDSRAKGFIGESVELDAIPAPTLRALVHSCIERHLDAETLARTRAIEEMERQTLAELAARWEAA